MNTIMNTTMNTNKTTLTRTFLWIALAVTIVGALAWMMASGHDAGWHDGSLMMFDEDLSDSVLGWAIAIPILIVTAVFVVIVLAGTGVLVAGVMAAALLVTLLALAFAFAVAILPFALFLAMPVLAIIGLIKLCSRPHARPQRSLHTQSVIS